MAKAKDILDSKEKGNELITSEFGLGRHTGRYMAQLATLSTVFMVGVIALMTFLLTAGLQHPKTDFSAALYATFISFSLSILSYMIGSALQARVLSLAAKQAATTDKAKLAEIEPRLRRSSQALKVARFVQQILFALGVIAITALAIIAAQLFFAAAASSAASTGASTGAATPTQ